VAGFFSLFRSRRILPAVGPARARRDCAPGRSRTLVLTAFVRLRPLLVPENSQLDELELVSVRTGRKRPGAYAPRKAERVALE